MLKHESKTWATPIAFVSIFTIFSIDYFTPKGSAEYIFYFIPVTISVLHPNSRFPFLIATFGSLMCLLGFFLSPSSNMDVDVLELNRLFSIVAMWFVAYLVKQIISSRNQVTVDTWIKNLVNELSFEIRGELTTIEIGNKILTLLEKKIDAKVSSIYLKDYGKKSLSYLTSYSYDTRDAKPQINFGEGIIGQVAIDKRLRIASDVSKEHVKLNTSLGQSFFTHIIIVPLTADDEIVAVMELAFIKLPDASAIEALNLIQTLSGTAIRSSQHKLQLSDLLHQSQQFSEELQAQQEELKVSNEELEQQTMALKTTHARLENQQAEMEQTNQMLEEQTQALESQAKVLDDRNTELLVSKKALEQKARELSLSSQYKSEFLANMSHELRTPLNSTLILAKLLLDNKSGNLSEEQVKYSEIIYNSGNDLLNLINDILDLSKVEAGKMTITPEVISLAHVIESMEQTFLPIAMQKKINFETLIDEGLAKNITTDRQRLEQILKNLLSNAFKFTAKGTVTLRVIPAGGQVTFSVSDTGVGISHNEQEVIFEAFRQADGTTNRKYGGTGLGLSISKELSHILGGEIKVDSVKGQGSTFTLNLPKEFNVEKQKSTKTISVQVEQLPIAKKKLPSIEPMDPIIKFSFEDDREKITNHKRTMLIIEDDEDFAKILFELAHEMNFGAIVAPTGAEGLSLAKQYVPHAIVLDVRLPDHSGMIVLDHLKMNSLTRHIPVHVISSEDFSRSALEMGAVGYMLKPVKRGALETAFQNMNSILEQKVKRVLVVEDDPVQRDHIAALISDKKIIVEAVETSQEALEKLSIETYDCMIMDLSLPDMSGHDLLYKLSNDNSTYSFPPVIVYTARDLTTEEEEKLRLYAGSIIIKGAKSPERLLSEVTLFLHRVETDLPLERQKMLKDLRSREKSLQEQKILVVDDDVRNIFALTSALESYGAIVETARNGVEAVDKIESDIPIDLVLMDIMMPEMNGYEAMRRIRNNTKFKDLPIIALTAKAMQDDKNKCLEAGANDYLPKPLEVDKLLSLIRVWLPQKRRFTN